MTRGRKPKAPHLRLVTGTHRADRHGDATKVQEAAASAAVRFGPLCKPKYLKGLASEAWKKYIEPANLLDASREPAAIAFCELWQEMRRAPTAFKAAKHSQLRAYMGDLGLTDERKRAVDDGKNEVKDEHFGD
jgi:phage terminase small subunit